VIDLEGDDGRELEMSAGSAMSDDENMEVVRMMMMMM
jgi:hypothetical protein